MAWKGPYKIKDLLANCLDEHYAPILKTPTVYLVSVNPWTNAPADECKPLYVGSNAKNGTYIKPRIGQMIGGIFGFYVKGHEFHSGSLSIFAYCKNYNVHPSDLYLSWDDGLACCRCEENNLYDTFKKLLLNKIRPPKCPNH
jgi:hypothetical protein